MHILYTDGGARGNPGPAAGAAVLQNEAEEVIATDAQYLGNSITNNVAEYQGLLLGLRLALANNATDLKVYMDSELIVMQVNGAYHVKQAHLRELYLQVEELKKQFNSFKVFHVRREKNKHADMLVNEALDAQALAVRA